MKKEDLFELAKLQDQRMDLMSGKIDLLYKLIQKMDERIDLNGNQIPIIYDHIKNIYGLIEQTDQDKKES